MTAFARFILRDNGLAIHIAPQHVTQVRETAEGDPAIYLIGKDTPLMIEGDVEDALRRLQAAAMGVPASEVRSEPDPEPEPEFEVEPDAAMVAPAKPAKARKPKVAKAKTPKAKPAVTAHAKHHAEDDGVDSSWFMGAR